MSLSKNKRQIEVFKAIQKLKRAKPAQVIHVVASVLGENEDNQALKRAIHRDLKALTNDNIVGVEYFTPSGEPIHPDDEDKHANLRVEYFLLTSAAEDVTGYSLLKEAGADLILPESLKGHFHLTDSLKMVGSGKYVVSFEVHQAHYLHLVFDAVDRPLTVHFGRNSKQMDSFESKSALMKDIESRAVVLLLPQKSVSRMKFEPTEGHCRLHFEREENQFWIEDNNSSLGTELYSTTPYEVEDLFHANQDATIRNPTSEGRKQVITQRYESELPSIIKLGGATVILSRS